MSWFLALLIRPFVLFLVALLLFAPAVYAIRRWLPDSRMKRLLLLRIHDGKRYTLLRELKSR